MVHPNTPVVDGGGAAEKVMGNRGGLRKIYLGWLGQTNWGPSH